LSSCSLNEGVISCKLRGLVEGEARGQLIVVRGALSFYGEVNPEQCTLQDGRKLAPNTILVFRESRGSTVAPYIMYSLKFKGCGPAGIVVVSAEPMLVAGAVMGEIALASGLPEEVLNLLSDGYSAMLVSRPPTALFTVYTGE
jgi:predicted aconitase with swiveling domain